MDNQPKSGDQNAWYVVGVLTLVFTCSHVDRQIMAILLEPIKMELGASDTAMGFLVGLTFALFYATLGMPIAWLADRVNRRNIIGAAITIWSAMTVLCGFAQNFFQLALARIGVGVGEAGSSPPSHSMIADLFPPETRGAAMGVFAAGVNLGILIAYLAGGWLSEHYGWRWTFIIVGVPGLAIAALLMLTVREPKRGAADAIAVDEDAPSFKEVWGTMWRNGATRHLVIGSSLAGFAGYGLVLWLPSFFQRSHGLSPSETGFLLAMMTGVVGAMGTFTAGKLADKLSERDVRWRAWVVAAAKIGYVPLLMLTFLAEDLRVAVALYVIPAFFGGFYLAPTFALIQGLVSVRMRALAASITLFILNIIGLGFGPQLVGILSDMFEPQYGVESLRYALVVLCLVNVWCGIHYWIAGNKLQREDAAAAG